MLELQRQEERLIMEGWDMGEISIEPMCVHACIGNCCFLLPLSHKAKGHAKNHDAMHDRSPMNEPFSFFLLFTLPEKISF